MSDRPESVAELEVAQLPSEARFAAQIRTVQVMLGEVALRMSRRDPDRLVLADALTRLNRIQKSIEAER